MKGIYYMKVIFNVLIILLLPAAVLAQYQIKVLAVRPVDSIVYIRGAVFDDKNFIPKDTIRLNGKSATLNVAKPIIGGVYFFYFPISKQKVYFILENKDTLSFRFFGSHYLDSMVTNTKKNKTLQSYQELEKKFSFVDSSYAAELSKGKKFNLAQKAVFFKSKTDTLIAFRKGAFASVVDSLKSVTKDFIMVHHDFDKVNIVKQDKKLYNELQDRLQDLRGVTIVVVSATDCIGSDEYNEVLSSRRTQKIKKDLAKYGGNNFVLMPVGEKQLIMGCSESDKDKNKQEENRYSYVFVIK